MTTPFDYTGRTVVITGAATGMGNETTRLLLEAGAEVHALDIADVAEPVAAVHQVDLSDPDAIDDALGALPDRIDCLMNCAGVPNGTRFGPLDIMKVNYLGLRHLTEAVLPRIPAEGSVTNIASIAGQGWPAHVGELTELMTIGSFADGLAWCEQRAELIGDGYFFSKECIQFLTMWRGVQVLRDHGVRMNSICPGPTDTKMMSSFRVAMGDAALDLAAQAGKGRMASAAEMAPAMLFLGSEGAASYVNGVNLDIDGGLTAALTTGQVDLSGLV